MSNLHDKHRMRMRARLRELGLDSFSDHEVLELLLFHAVPRVNTNEIAHRLLNRFDTLSGVFDASYEDLLSVDGIGENSATLISLMLPLMRRYSIDRETPRRKFASLDEIGAFLVNRFLGISSERVELLTFDAGDRYMKSFVLNEGSASSSEINTEKLAEIVFGSGAVKFVLAHNHPNGTLEPSIDDLNSTFRIYNAFRCFNISLVEHFVIADGKYRGILGQSLANYADSQYLS